jgi:5'-phosphate synthase pdxT subunit
MNRDVQEQLVRHCLCGGAIIEVRTAAEARRAQALGAVGVVWAGPESSPRLGELRRILEAISILPLCFERDRPLFEQVYREHHAEAGPSWFALVTPGEQTTAPQAQLLPCVPSPDCLPTHRPEPVFVLCNGMTEALQAMRAGADGTVLRFLPDEREVDQLWQVPEYETRLADRQPGERVIGVVGLQGDYRLQQAGLERAVGAPCDAPLPAVRVQLVRSPAEFEAVDALVLPGGWSNLQSRMMRTTGLDARVRMLHARGVPMLTICAGMILARSRDGKGCEDRLALRLVEMTIDNNAVNGFRSVCWADGRQSRVPFANAPVVAAHGPEVRCLARLDSGEVVGVQQVHVFAFAFHDEVHDVFVRHCRHVWR